MKEEKTKEKKFDLELAENLIHALLFKAYKLDKDDPGLKDTPRRIAKMYDELIAEVHSEKPNFKVVFPNDEKNHYDGIILSDCLHFWSLCEHHFLPFGGYGWVAYIPNEKEVTGLSKLGRILNFYSKRPQIQERLTSQIANFIMEEFNPLGVMVYLRAKHGCTQCRGLKADNRSGMTTNVCKGSFREDSNLELKALEMIKISLSMEGL